MEGTTSSKMKFNYKVGFWVAAGLLALGLVGVILDKKGVLDKWMSKPEETPEEGKG